jgi:hypothetical protein
MNVFEIDPGRGVGPVRFGQTPAEVEAAMAEPQMYEEWMGGNLNDSLLFRGLILGFDHCNARGPLPKSRLVEARIAARPGAYLFSRPAEEWTRDDLLTFLRLQGHEPDQHHAKDLNVAALGLSITFEHSGKVDYIELWEPQHLRDRKRQ